MVKRGKREGKSEEGEWEIARGGIGRCEEREEKGKGVRVCGNVWEERKRKRDKGERKREGERCM